MAENPYESPGMNAGVAKYDHTLFWRIVKASLIIGGILLVVDFGWWLVFSQRQESLGEWGPTKFMLNLRWDELRQILRI
jgi:hypothetical protein